ncbi:hypothetical protein Tola_1134 [Tolumonas auensis DSM 9187]|jgi:hypothetical protein|uniref:Uncharacterized protein n=1 Tax=Tolumonas auensis (strain DSM 9187 / NBRC 110442 / TA 4) TaxID=595494 RepID=C4LDG4_TOLAT|nr:hypothetical protein Tola_1134 [Tolumonas auensis DSM 9187]
MFPHAFANFTVTNNESSLVLNSFIRLRFIIFLL